MFFTLSVSYTAENIQEIGNSDLLYCIDRSRVYSVMSVKTVEYTIFLVYCKVVNILFFKTRALMWINSVQYQLVICHCHTNFDKYFPL